MRISFLHTADVHMATFDAIFAKLRPDAELIHHVDASLLDQARKTGLDAVRAETLNALQAMASADAVMCTCSTLGPLIDEFSLPHTMRIDRPMMDRACQTGPHVLVAICLESTRAATLALLAQSAAASGRAVSPQIVVCQQAWTAFERGDLVSYASQIADKVKATLTNNKPVDCVVLGQASMHVAADHLHNIEVPVLSSPVMAAQHAIVLANGGTRVDRIANQSEP